MPTKRKKSSIARFALSGKRYVRGFMFDKKAASVVVGTLILTAGVLAMGIAILYWASSWGSLATRTYSTAEGNSAKAVQERLGYEYIDYSNNILTVNVINWGTSANLTIANVYVYDNTHQYVGNYSSPTLRNISTSSIVASGLPVGGEGYFQITPNPAFASGSFYYIRVVTDRGRTFDGSFATQ
jgi:uncharacterized protein (UPF0333 family)